MKNAVLFFGVLFFIGFIFAIPSLPHVFNGVVEYSGNSNMVLSGYDISASVGSYDLGIVGSVEEGNTYEVFIDPQGHSGEITFYVGGVEAEEKEDYEWGGFSPDFKLTINEIPVQTACGNGIQEPGEQCDGTNLGVGTCENVLGIAGASGILSCTSVCTFDYSNCSAPYCGDGVCSAGETCSSCSTDCGQCTGSSSSSSGGSSSSSSSGGSSSSSSSGGVIVLSADDTKKDTENEQSIDLSALNKDDEKNTGLSDETQDDKQSFFKENTAGVIIVLIFIVLAILVGVMSKRMKRERKIKDAISQVQTTSVKEDKKKRVTKEKPKK